MRIYYPAENQTTVFTAPASINTVAMPILGCQGTTGYEAYFFAQSLTGAQYYNCMGGGPVFGCNLYIDQPGTYTVVAAIQDYGKYVRSANYATIVVNP